MRHPHGLTTWTHQFDLLEVRGDLRWALIVALVTKLTPRRRHEHRIVRLLRVSLSVIVSAGSVSQGSIGLLRRSLTVDCALAPDAYRSGIQTSVNLLVFEFFLKILRVGADSKRLED